MNHMPRRVKFAGLLLIMGSMAFPAPLHARRIKTSHKVTKIPVETVIYSRGSERTSVRADSTQEWKNLAGRIRFSGFDKTPSSTKESFFITNMTDSVLRGLTVDIEYTDLSGRLLHERSVDIDCEIPSTDTRRVDIPTWDIQHSFRHYRCSATRRPTTPFRVKITPLSLAF